LIRRCVRNFCGPCRNGRNGGLGSRVAASKLKSEGTRIDQMETKYGVAMLACMAFPFLLTGMLEIIGWLKRKDIPIVYGGYARASGRGTVLTAAVARSRYSSSWPSSRLVISCFWGRVSASPSNMEMMLRRMKIENATVRGFCSSFRDWAGNVSSFPREVTEPGLGSCHQRPSRLIAGVMRWRSGEDSWGLLQTCCIFGKAEAPQKLLAWLKASWSLRT
jgi:hypothetical protein